MTNSLRQDGGAPSPRDWWALFGKDIPHAFGHRQRAENARETNGLGTGSARASRYFGPRFEPSLPSVRIGN